MRTVVPIILGIVVIFIACISIRDGEVTLKGGGSLSRSKNPVGFWFCVSWFVIFGIIQMLIGLANIFH